MVQKSRQKFVELAEKRVNRTIKDIKLIGNLSNRSNYKYEEADVRAIFTVLERELKQARERYHSHLNDSAEKPFQLKL
jgi:hypothetical protein